MATEVVVGKVVDAFGIKGWLKIQSYTRPCENILGYSPWRLGYGSKDGVRLLKGRVQGNIVLAQIEGIETREAALSLKQCYLLVDRESFPDLEGKSYYWTDLIGLDISNTGGVDFGKVQSLIETGANDVLVARIGDKERLIPFALGNYVKSVDLLGRRIVVDWDPDF